MAGASGQTDLATVIAGVGWTIANQSNDNISVLNMSLGYLPVESTVLDPLDQAVEPAWEAGITVVTSAGNSGPDNGTVLSPGDDPLVITTGAIDDGAQADPASDTMTTFSSVGPTNPDGWFKPDLVTSGRSVVSLRDPGFDDRHSEPVGPCRQRKLRRLRDVLQFGDHERRGRPPDRGAPSDTPNTVKGTLLGTTAPGPWAIPSWTATAS